MKRRVQKLSLSAILCACAMVLLFFGVFIPALDLTAAVAAGLTVAVAVIECGTLWGFALYAATAILAFVLLPGIKTPALFYTVIGGIYPILKSLVERIKNPYLVWGIKLAGFNIFYTGFIYIGKMLFQINDPIFAFNVLVYGIGNLTFIVYDIAFTRMVTVYIRRIRRNLK